MMMGIKKKTLFVLTLFSALLCSPLNRGPVATGIPDPNHYCFLQGNFKTTGELLDLGIDGDGLFILKKGSDFFYYRRPGSFFQDKNGYFVLAFDSMRLQGIELDDSSTRHRFTIEDLVDIKIPVSLMDDPKATSNVKFAGNLDAGPLRTWTDASISVYDGGGIMYSMMINFEPTNEPDKWDWIISISNNAQIINGDSGSIHFCADGSPDTVIFRDFLRTFVFVSPYTADTIRISLDMGMKGTFRGLTNFIAPVSVDAMEHNGHEEGILNDLCIAERGEIYGIFSNGNSKGLFRILFARFPCWEGLKTVNERFFSETEYSGGPFIDDRNASCRPGCVELDP
jgi:flagellar hook protein FlgE